MHRAPDPPVHSGQRERWAQRECTREATRQVQYSVGAFQKCHVGVAFAGSARTCAADGVEEYVSICLPISQHTAVGQERSFGTGFSFLRFPFVVCACVLMCDIYIYVYIHLSIYVYTYTYIHVDTYIYIHTYVHIYIYICKRMHMQTYIQTHVIYVYIYIYILLRVFTLTCCAVDLLEVHTCAQVCFLVPAHMCRERDC